MRLEVTRKSELAVRALRELQAHGHQVKGEALAKRLNTSVGFLAQVMGPMVRAGWVRSEPGPTGGYVLKADLSTVHLLEVVEAIEGSVDNGRCVLADRPCATSGRCALHDAWQRARHELTRERRSTSIALAELHELDR